MRTAKIGPDLRLITKFPKWEDFNRLYLCDLLKLVDPEAD